MPYNHTFLGFMEKHKTVITFLDFKDSRAWYDRGMIEVILYNTIATIILQTDFNQTSIVPLSY